MALGPGCSEGGWVWGFPLNGSEGRTGLNCTREMRPVLSRPAAGRRVGRSAVRKRVTANNSLSNTNFRFRQGAAAFRAKGPRDVPGGAQGWSAAVTPAADYFLSALGGEMTASPSTSNVPSWLTQVVLNLTRFFSATFSLTSTRAVTVSPIRTGALNSRNWLR